MGVNFQHTFGNKMNAGLSNGSSGRGNREAKPDPQLWLNVGYQIEVEGEAGPETRFVSLPMGIPLDTMDAVKTNSSNELYAAFQQARNDLWQQMLDIGAQLKAGEERIIALDSEVGLAIQIRRVNAAREAVKPEANPFSRRLALGAKAAA